ncbi:hypothetical protein [Polystyrenella longa]|nr:hypothetical protein [Polystyrenella longa]
MSSSWSASRKIWAILGFMFAGIVLLFLLTWFASRPPVVAIPQVMTRDASGKFNAVYDYSWGLGYLSSPSRGSYQTDIEVSSLRYGDFAKLKTLRFNNLSMRLPGASVVDTRYSPENLFLSERRVAIVLNSDDILLRAFATKLVGLCEEKQLGETIEIYQSGSGRDSSQLPADLTIELTSLPNRFDVSGNSVPSIYVHLHTNPDTHPLSWDFGHLRRVRQLDLRYVIQVNKGTLSWRSSRARIELISEKLGKQFEDLFQELGDLQKLRDQVDERRSVFQPDYVPPPEFVFLHRDELAEVSRSHGYLKPNETVWHLDLTRKAAEELSQQIRVELAGKGWQSLPSKMGLLMTKGNDRLLFAESHPAFSGQSMIQQIKESSEHLQRILALPLERQFQYRESSVRIKDTYKVTGYRYRKWFHLDDIFTQTYVADLLVGNLAQRSEGSLKLLYGERIVSAPNSNDTGGVITSSASSKNTSDESKSKRLTEEIQVFDELRQLDSIPSSSREESTEYRLHYLNVLEPEELTLIAEELYEQSASINEQMLFGEYLPEGAIQKILDALESVSRLSDEQELQIASLYLWKPTADLDKAKHLARKLKLKQEFLKQIENEQEIVRDIDALNLLFWGQSSYHSEFLYETKSLEEMSSRVLTPKELPLELTVSQEHRITLVYSTPTENSSEPGLCIDSVEIKAAQEDFLFIKSESIDRSGSFNTLHGLIREGGSGSGGGERFIIEVTNIEDSDQVKVVISPATMQNPPVADDVTLYLFEGELSSE